MTIPNPFVDDSIVLGSTAPPFPFPTFKLDKATQRYHACIWGLTGSGKSRLLESIFIQHLNKKHGVGLIEPHHDLSFDTLCYLLHKGFFKNQDSFDRLIYLDWGNGFVPFNILADDGRTSPHSRALNCLEAMIRVWPELEQAPLFQTLFLSSLMALIANQLPITFLYQLLADGTFRKQCLEQVTDPLVHQTFASFDQLGRNQTEAAGSTLRRAFLLSFSPLARLTLGQPENWLNFRSIMDSGRSFIINLGNVNDHETKKLLGAMLMVQIEQAALSRTDLQPSHRTPATLLVDEWPSFAAEKNTISAVLSQCRKYNLRLYLSAQSLSQVSSDRLAGALENCGLQVSFGLGRDSAAIESRHIGKADPFLVKEEALTTTQHAQYMPVAEQFESWTQELQNLSPRLAYVKLRDQPAAKIKTLSVPDVNDKVDPNELEEVLGEYKRRYQRTQAEAEQAIARITQQVSAQTSGQQSKPPAYTILFQQPNN